MRIGWLFTLLVAAAPFACSEYGTADDAPPPASDIDAAVAPDSSDAATIETSTPPDANVDAAPTAVCDRFRGPGAISDGSFWSALIGTPPIVTPGLISFEAESSGSNYLQSVTLPRGDTVRFTAGITIHRFDPPWDEAFEGWSRIFEVDASIDEDQGELVALEVHGTSWRLVYRTPDGGQVNEPGPPLIVDHDYDIELEARFSPSDGYIHVRFDVGQGIAVDDIATSATARPDWILRVGPHHQGPTPPVSVDVREVCVSP